MKVSRGPSPINGPFSVVILAGGGAYPSEQNEFVKWDDDIPQVNVKIKRVPNHQRGHINQ